MSRLGTGADTGFGALLLLAVRPVALPHVSLSHVDPDRVCAILSMVASAWTPPLSLGCQSFFLN